MSVTTFSKPAWTPARLHRVPAVLAVIGVHVLAIGALLQDRPRPQERSQLSLLQVDLLQPSLPDPIEATPLAVLPQLPHVDAIALPVFQIDLPRERVVTVSTTSEPAAAPRVHNAPLYVSDVQYVREPQPSYPAPSRRDREQGTVVIRALIEPTGLASEADVHRSSGHERLDEAARVAVLQALFKPYLENGIARSVVVLIPIEFALGRHASRESRGTETISEASNRGS